MPYDYRGESIGVAYVSKDAEVCGRWEVSSETAW